MINAIVEPIDANTIRFITPDGVAILEVVGLDDDDSAFMTINQICGDCGKHVSSTTYDVRNANPDEVVFRNGAIDGEKMRAHWAAHKGS